MRVVFDTNILISALIFPSGRAEAAVLRVINGMDEMIISREIIREVLSVLAGKFGKDREELSRIAVLLSEIGKLTVPSVRLRVLRDDPDNRILECAVAGEADAVVTGDKAILALREFRGIRLLSLSAYLAGNGWRFGVNPIS
jgi:putative PIN family toxin of toxin-antitoxin system